MILLRKKKFNEEKGKKLTVYGCITSASEWQFVKLEDNILTFDNSIYTLSEIDKILGIFQYIINEFKEEDSNK